MVTNVLTDIRSEIKDALTDAGLKAVEHVVDNATPPVCVVVPGSPYVFTGEGNTFGEYTVSVLILIIGGKGTNKASAQKVDAMVVDVVDAIDHSNRWEITEVTAHQEMTVKGIAYLGAVVAVETNTKIDKEVI